MSTSLSTSCKIIILTGEIHCGKSRALGRFLTEPKDHGKIVMGLLNPSIDHEKWFVNLHTEDIFSAEKMAEVDSPIKVGKYQFSTAAFERAKTIISEPVTGPCDFFIIDELGKLELENRGLEPAISDFLKRLPNTQIKNVIIVIRDFLVEDAKTYFKIEPTAIVKQTGLNQVDWN